MEGTRINYKNGDLFNAPQKTVLVHSCNCKGVWGAGVASSFRLLFPKAYHTYRQHCFNNGSDILGSTLLIPTPNYTIGCLITSDGYGNKRDSEKEILINTESAINSMLLAVNDLEINEIHSPKINSGLFGVPWNKTEAVIQSQLNLFPKINWTVWTL